MKPSVHVLLLATALGLGAVAASAQTPAPGPAGPFERLVLSPEFATPVNGWFPRGARDHLFGVPPGNGVHTLSARLEPQPARRLSPFLTAGLVISAGDRASDALLALAGARVDLLRASSTRRVEPYVVGGAGAVVVGEPTGRFIPSLGLGARLLHAGDFAPHLELRWERYNGSGYAMLGIGVNLLLTHHGTSAVE